ncbi:MAG: hypothetical protein IPI82_08980 [Candidatus Microthrix sp.]|nr:hypothetical protein [Candidatus Microthrix sp.]MBK7322572.1 hypothetical protein [Candidatus Microthrix sp.]
MNRLVRVRLVAGWLLVMGVVAALGCPPVLRTVRLPILLTPVMLLRRRV